MEVLLIGGGGREHALGWKIAQSPHLSKLYLAPGNPGLNQLGAPIDISPDDIDGIVGFVAEKMLDLVVVGPEAPLAAGIADKLAAAGIACFGPTADAARLETSKAFMKDVCQRAGAPTAGYGRFTDKTPARDFLQQMTAPYVIKADGLAAGKGVVIAETRVEAEAAIDRMLTGAFGAASTEIIIEEFMDGEEASFFVLTDGEHILAMPAMQDHKRAFDGDKGPNTGGMGAYGPAPVFTPDVEAQTINEIILPVLAEMRRRGTPYRGILYAGLMIKNGTSRLVEFNARFGDPECQALMRLLNSDILPVLKAVADGDISGKSLDWSADAVALVVMAAEGYPGPYNKGEAIKGVPQADLRDHVKVFHAGTRLEDGILTAHGGRVLNITATGNDIGAAIERAYGAIEEIAWPGGFFRRDIGWRALRPEA